MKQEKSHTQGEKTEKSSPPSSYESSGYFSKLFCLYVFPFLYRYYRKDFDLNAIEENAKSHSCELLGQQFKKYFFKLKLVVKQLTFVFIF